MGKTHDSTPISPKYRIEAKIGEGGMGVVYRAVQKSLNRDVALKVLRPDLLQNPNAIERFRREAQLAGSLGHENLVTVLDVDSDESGVPFLVMEYLHGETLEARLKRQSPLQPAHAVTLITQAARGLQIVHAAGIVHRDIKPSNLFICVRENREILKVTDFGVAKLNSDNGPNLTKTGSVVGTPCYMSPEQARGNRDIDYRTDIHALGAILYEMLCGQRVYPGSTQNEVIFRIASGPPIPLLDLAPWIDSGLAEVVQHALEQQPESRIRSMVELERRLIPFVEHPAVASFPMPNKRDQGGDTATTNQASSLSSDIVFEELKMAQATAPNGSSLDGSVNEEAHGSGRDPVRNTSHALLDRRREPRWKAASVWAAVAAVAVGGVLFRGYVTRGASQASHSSDLPVGGIASHAENSVGTTLVNSDVPPSVALVSQPVEAFSSVAPLPVTPHPAESNGVPVASSSAAGATQATTHTAPTFDKPPERAVGQESRGARRGVPSFDRQNPYLFVLIHARAAMKTSRVQGVALSFLIAMSWVGQARADDAQEARKRFDQAILLVEEGSFAEALAEFEKAYSLKPSVPVLYNIGMTYVALGKPVEASNALERYLLEGGSTLPPKRRAQATAELARQRARIALLELDIKPAGAEVRVDGDLIGRSPINLPVRVGLGTHKVSATMDGFVAQEATVRVASDERVHVEMALVPNTPKAEPQATIVVNCNVPGVRVYVDGQHQSTLPTTPLQVPVGAKKIAFSRPGYSEKEHSLSLTAGQEYSINCEVARLPALDKSQAATLRVVATPNDAKIFVDGELLGAESTIPSGIHRLEVRRAGYSDWARDVTLTADTVTIFEATLDLSSPNLLNAAKERWTRRKIVSASLVGLGAATIATGVGLSVWNSDRYDTWRSENDAIRTAWLGSGASARSIATRRSENVNLGDSISLVDKVSVGTAIAGGALITAGVIWYLTGTKGVEGISLEATSHSSSIGFRGAF